MSALGKRFEREVFGGTEYDVFAPVRMVVTISPTLAGKIREWAAIVKSAGAFALTIFDNSPSWYEENDEDENMLGDLSTNLRECVRLKVTDANFWWEANSKSTGSHLASESISIGEL